MLSDRSCGPVAALAGALMLAVGVALGGCGDDPAPRATSTPRQTQTAPATAKQPAGTSDRGARRCTRTAILAALLADVDQLPFRVSGLRCEGKFARARFAFSNCPAGQTSPACGRAKVAAWRLGSKRWRLITYADALTCTEIRRTAADFPQSLCG
jgi:hypothetical protein